MTLPKCSVIATANQKGGVGKTTTAVNLAQAIAIRQPQDQIVLIDCDPQGNVTQASGIKLDSERLNL